MSDDNITEKKMNIESIRTYCLSLPLVTEDMPFDDTTVVFRVLGKIFLLLDLDRPEWVSMKCDADFAIELRDAHTEIEGAFHMNKKYWNQLNLYGFLDDALIERLIRHSYSEVVKKMTRKQKAENPEITTVE